MLNTGLLQRQLLSQLQNRLEQNLYESQQMVEATVKLYLIMPNTEKKSPVAREVTINNYQECFYLFRDSGLFEFGVFNMSSDEVDKETTTPFGKQFDAHNYSY